MRSFVLASQPTCAKRESTLMRSAHVQTTGAHLSATQRLRFIRGNVSHKTSWSTVLSSALWKIGAPCETSISASLFFPFFLTLQGFLEAMFCQLHRPSPFPEHFPVRVSAKACVPTFFVSGAPARNNTANQRLQKSSAVNFTASWEQPRSGRPQHGRTCKTDSTKAFVLKIEFQPTGWMRDRVGNAC